MDNIIGARIRYLRVTNNMLQRELAEKINVNNNTLSQYESGKRIPSDEIKLRIANIFGVSMDYLLGMSNDPGTPPDDDTKSRISSRVPALIVTKIAMLATSNASAAQIMEELPDLTEAQLNRILGYIQALKELPDDSDKTVILEKNA